MTKKMHRITDEEAKLIEELRAKNPSQASLTDMPPTLGQRAADAVTRMAGSWKFLIIQSVILVAWIIMNSQTGGHAWDPYPFILLNLALSFQAAYTAPVILMSQNREAQIDRQRLQNDYQINLKAELEIELLHQKIDELEIRLLHEKVDALTEVVKLLGQVKQDKVKLPK